MVNNYKQANERLNSAVSDYDNQKNNQINELTNKYNQEIQRKRIRRSKRL